MRRGKGMCGLCRENEGENGGGGALEGRVEADGGSGGASAGDGRWFW